MKRVAALYLPLWPVERIWREGRRTATRPDGPSASLDPLLEAAAREQEHACSVPRGGGWRPGARWAREDSLGKVAVLAKRQPARHEVGWREEPAPPPFRAMRPDDGGAAVRLLHSSPSLSRGGGPAKLVEGPLRNAAVSRAESVAPPSSRVPGRIVPRTILEPAGQVRPDTPLHRPADGPPPRGKLGEELAPLVTSLKTGSQNLVTAVCPRARALGLVPGMALSQARAQTPGLDIRPADPEGDREELIRMATAFARRWSPLVMLDGEDGLFLDMTGASHLFGGEEKMARKLVRLLARLGFTARIAVADTAGAAHALVRCHDRSTLCPPGEHETAIAALPVRALRIDQRATELLARLGVDRIGELAKLPRGPLVRRFGTDIAARLDQALGRLPEPLDPIVPADPILVTLRFAEPILTAEGIEHWLARLVPQLAEALAAQGLGALRLELVADRIDGVPQHIRIGLARPNRDPAHLLRLLVRRIEQVEPGFGIDALSLHVRRSGLLGAEPITERIDEEAAPDLAPLVDTLATRIGMGRMWRMRAVESDVPERSLTRAPVLDPPERAAPRGKIDAVGQLDRFPVLHPWHPYWPKPARLLARPERIDHVLAELPDHAPRRFTWRGQAHQVIRADGPERIHGEWWRRDAERNSVRDYFRVEDEAGRRYWLFRRGDGERAVTGDLSWYLHGVFG